jgi:nucleoside-diphosphate-sugar epimerase
MNVLVTGGTGVLGRQVVTRLRSRGHRILTRNPEGHIDAVQGDLATGAGLVKAVAGILHLPFKFSRQFASGCLLVPDHKDEKITFEQYLEEKYPT